MRDATHRLEARGGGILPHADRSFASGMRNRIEAAASARGGGILPHADRSFASGMRNRQNVSVEYNSKPSKSLSWSLYTKG
jgi:hypothetical protein